MRLIVVRHGQTTCNVVDRWHGWDDCELTEIGHEQARSAAQRLAREPVSAVYTSDSPRARQTAEAIAGVHGLTPVPDRGLRERKAGDFEGMLEEEVGRLHPTVWKERAANYWGWSPPNGESFAEVLERVLAVVDRVKVEHGDETVVLVSHMGATRVLISHLTGIPLDETYTMHFPSTAVSIFDFDGDSPSVETLNDGSHIA